MPPKKRRLQIVISILILFSITCNLPQLGQSAESATVEELTTQSQQEPQEEAQPLTVIDETYTEDVEPLLDELRADPSTMVLIDMLEADGYDTYLESGIVTFDNGLIMRSLEVTDGEENVLLAQFESAAGGKEDMVFTFPEKGTMEVWDETGGMRFVFEGDGTAELLELDAAGEVVEEESALLQSENLLASKVIPPQRNLCMMTGVGEFRQCLGDGLTAMLAVPGCAAAVGVIIAGTGGTGAALAGVVVGMIGGCGKLALCISTSADDDPPTAVWAEIPKPTTDSYKRCLNPDTLVMGALYTIKVGCQDDRLPNAELANPNNEYLSNVGPNEVSENGLCVDCSGQKGGSITGPKWDSFEECKFGCVNVGDTDARCLAEEEANGQQTSEEESNAGHTFNIEDCSCAGVNVALSDNSSVFNNSYDSSAQTGETVTYTGGARCYLEEAYTSENITGTIIVNMTINKFDSLEHAQLIFAPLRDDIDKSYCEAEPERCTVTAYEFGEKRVFYANGNIYVGGKGELPSSHGADLVQIITNQHGSFVINVWVSHPELEMGNTWVIDTALAAEACALKAISE